MSRNLTKSKKYIFIFLSLFTFFELNHSTHASVLIKTYINLGKAVQKSVPSDIPKNYDKISEILSKIAYDFTMEGSNGFIKNGVYHKEGVNSNFQKSQELSGDKNSYAGIPTTSKLKSAEYVTVEAMININAHGTSSGEYDTLFSKQGSYALAIDRVTNKLSGSIWTFGGPWYWVKSNLTVPMNQWNHVAMTWDGDKLTFHLNGQEWVQDYPLKGKIRYDSFYGYGIGRKYVLSNGELLTEDSSVDFTDVDWDIFKGQIDEVRLWNRALSKEELIENAKRPLIGDEENLLGYWHFYQ